MSYIQIKNQKYPATVKRRYVDTTWDHRQSMEITLSMTVAEAVELFVDGLIWTSGVDGRLIDCSEYNLAGPVIDNRDGTVTVKMGRATERDILTALLGG